MNRSEQDIDHLFGMAKQDAPHISFEAAQAAFLKSSTQILKDEHSFWRRFLTFKNIMIMTLSAIIISTVLLLPGTETTQSTVEKSSPKHQLINGMPGHKLNELRPGKFGELQVCHEQTNTYEPEQVVMGKTKNDEDKSDNIIKETQLDTIEFTSHEKPGIPNKVEAGKPHDKAPKLKLTKKSFEISSETTRKELEAIQKEAKKAGIKFVYSGKFKKNGIKRLSIAMYIEKNKSHKIRSFFRFWRYKNSTFNYELKWREDADGNAFDFDGNEAKPCSNERTSQN